MMWSGTLLFGISGGEILILLLLVLILFGPKKIPEIARMVGRGMNEVKKVQREINSEIHRYSSEIEEETRKMAPDRQGKEGTESSKEMTSAGQAGTGDREADHPKPGVQPEHGKADKGQPTTPSHENKPGGPSQGGKPGDPPKENQSGGPPVESKPGGPSVGENPGDPPLENKPGGPPQREKQGEPPVGKKPGGPPGGENRDDPPLENNSGGPPQREKPGDPSPGNKPAGDEDDLPYPYRRGDQNH